MNMPIPTMNMADREKERTRREANLGRLYQAGKTLNDFPRKAASFAMRGLFGDDSGNPLAVSMIPGADLAAKIKNRQAPGLFDIPGPGTFAKAGLLGLSKPMIKEIMERTGYKMAKDAGEEAASKVGKELAKRSERLPEELAESIAATVGEKSSPYAGFKIPTLGKGASLNTGKGMKSYYNGYGGGSSNSRQVWVNPNLSPEEQARELIGRIGGNATPAELTKFGSKDPSVFRQLGLQEQGNFGDDIMSSVYSKNKGLFDEMRKYGDEDSFSRIADYIKSMQGNSNLRMAQKYADLKAEGADELSDMFAGMSGGVPLKRMIKGEGMNNTLMGLLDGSIKKNQIGEGLVNPAGKQMQKLVESMNGSYPEEELYKMLAGGGMKANSPTMGRKFSDLGGMDFDRIRNDMVPTMMKSITDRSNSMPLKNGFDKTLKDLMKAAGNDPRQRKFGRVRSINFDELFK